MKHFSFPFLISFLGCLGSGCVPTASPTSDLKVIAVENFLAEIAQNIAGDRLSVSALIPFGIEPHEFEPAPKDLAVVAQSDLLILNGGGLEGWLAEGLRNIGGSRILVTASNGLTSRATADGQPASNSPQGNSSPIIDPHFWMDPILVKTYVVNIREGLIQLDPLGQAEYRRNAETYSLALDDLDRWIRSQVALIPAAQKLLITNHESLGYFADRYGFTIPGTIFPGVSPDAQPSAAQIAELVVHIRASKVKAIFLETGANTQLADQIASESGCQVVTGLYTHSLTPPGGVASTYLEMMRYDVNILVEALR